jgi:hypothetical protein
VSWDGAQVGDLISANGSDLLTTSWKIYRFAVKASSSLTRLELADQGPSTTYGTLIDQVSLTELVSGNDAWTKAQPVALTPYQSASVEQYIFKAGQSAWFKFPVLPGSKLVVTLSGLTANYDLTLYKDIAAAFQTLNSPQDLARIGAEVAPDAFSPDAFSPDAFSPDAFSPDAFSPDAFSPDAFSPDAFSPDAFSPDAFSPDAFSPDAFSPTLSARMLSVRCLQPGCLQPRRFQLNALWRPVSQPDWCVGLRGYFGGGDPRQHLG